MAETLGGTGTAPTGQGSSDPQRGHVVDEAKAAVRGMADAQKRKVADRLDGVARALHDTARGLDREKLPVGRYAEMAADQVDRVCGALRERGIEDLVGDAEDFARRQPLLFVGGALAAGVMLARFLKHSGQGAMEETMDDMTDEARRVAGTTAASVAESGRRMLREGQEAGGDIASEVMSGAAGSEAAMPSRPGGPAENRSSGEPS